MTKHNKNKKQMGGGMFDGFTNAISGAFSRVKGAVGIGSGTAATGPGSNPVVPPPPVPGPGPGPVSGSGPVPADAKGPEERAAKETAEKNAKCDEITKKEKEDADKKNVTCKAATPGFKLGFLGFGGKRTRGGKRTSKRTSKRTNKQSRAKNSKTAKNGKK